MQVIKKLYKKSLLGSKDEEQVNDLVMKQQAIPEIRFKLDIFDHRRNIIESERTLQRQRLLNNNNVSENQLSDFKVSLICLFNDLKYMIIEKGLNQGNFKHKYDLTEQLELLQLKMNLTQLLIVKNYLLECLHRLNLTNLLIDNSMNDEESILKQLENEY